MFHNRQLNNRINRLHERALRLIYNDYKRSFQELLIHDGSVTIHHRNLQYLAIEMFKLKNNIPSSNQLTDIIDIKPLNDINLRNKTPFLVPSVNTEFKGKSSIRFLGPQIWNLLPESLKSVETLSVFKTLIKTWIPNKCPCRLCKTFINNVGFID